MAPQKRLNVPTRSDHVEKSGKKAEKGTIVPEVKEKKSVKRDVDVVAEPVCTAVEPLLCRRSLWLSPMRLWRTTRTRRLLPQSRRRRVDCVFWS